MLYDIDNYFIDQMLTGVYLRIKLWRYFAPFLYNFNNLLQTINFFFDFYVKKIKESTIKL